MVSAGPLGPPASWAGNGSLREGCARFTPQWTLAGAQARQPRPPGYSTGKSRAGRDKSTLEPPLSSRRCSMADSSNPADNAEPPQTRATVKVTRRALDSRGNPTGPEIVVEPEHEAKTVPITPGDFYSQYNKARGGPVEKSWQRALRQHRRVSHNAPTRVTPKPNW